MAELLFEKYFQNKIGEVITRTVTSGNRFFTEVYARKYFIEVLAVKNGRVYVDVTSVDIVPSGGIQGGSQKYFGDFTVDINEETRIEIIFNIIAKADLAFLRRYNIQNI